MDLIRKTLSAATFGLIDYRSDKGTARHARQSVRQTKKQTKITQEQLTLLEHEVVPQPAGWYPSPSDGPDVVRYWNGKAWTGQFSSRC